MSNNQDLETYKFIFENSLEAILLTQPDGSIIAANPAAEELFGYSETELCKLGRSGIVDPDDTNLPILLEERKLKGEIKGELTFIRKGGEKFTGLMSSHIFHDEYGNEKTSMVIIDLTNVKEAENKIRESENKYRTFFDNAADGILLMRKDRFVDCNQSALDIYGATRDQLIGSTPYTIFSPEEQPDGKMSIESALKHINDALDGHPQHFEWKHLKYDGTPFYTEVTLNRFKIGDEYYLQAIVRDVTSRKEIENNLHKTLHENEIIGQMSMQLVGMANTGDIYHIIGKAVKELLPNSYVIVSGLSPDGENINIMDIVGLSSLNKIKSILKIDPYKLRFPVVDIKPEELKKHRSEVLKEYKDGIHDLTFGIIPRPICKLIEKLFHIEEVHSIRFSFEEKHYGGLSILLMKDQPMDHKEAVETIVHLASIAIRRSRAEENIKYSLKEKEMLLKEIHHRVKNNLQIISSLLNLQEDYVKEDSTAMNVLIESQNRVLSMAMIHELLYQSQDLNKINFADYIHNMVYNLFSSYGAKNNIIPRIDVDDVFLNIETAVPCGLIISELVSNSLKYAYPNNEAGEIAVSLHLHDDELELIISDNGVGLPEDLDFRNVQSSLGINLVNSLVNQLDGTIDLDRSRGTKFNIKFKELRYTERIKK